MGLDYDTESPWGNQIQECTMYCIHLNNQQVLDKAFFQDLLILEDQGNIFLKYVEHDHSVTSHHIPVSSIKYLTHKGQISACT